MLEFRIELEVPATKVLKFAAEELTLPEEKILL
jgi:hypothetical protein